MPNFILQKFYYERGLSFCSFISKFTQLKGWKLVLATLKLVLDFREINHKKTFSPLIHPLNSEIIFASKSHLY